MLHVSLAERCPSWSKEQHWKCCSGVTRSWVRIPVAPPLLSSKGPDNRGLLCNWAAGVIGSLPEISQCYRSLGNNLESDDSQPGQAKHQSDAKATETILHASSEADRGRIGRVSRGTADLADRETVPDDLGQHLVIEHEIIRIAFERQAFQAARGRMRGSRCGIRTAWPRSAGSRRVSGTGWRCTSKWAFPGAALAAEYPGPNDAVIEPVADQGCHPRY